MNRPLEQRVALVTGAAGGIGSAIARRLAHEGATLVLSDRDAEGLQRTLSSLEGEGGLRVLVHDVTSEADWHRVVADIEGALGRLDILVNNAGGGRLKSIAEMTYEDWRYVQALNLDSVFLGTKAALPLLADSGHGAIVNVSSVRGFVVGAGSSAYSAAKSGVRLFTKATAIECAEAGNGVRANSIHPGYVESGGSQRPGAEDYYAAILASIPMRRFANPDEIAAAVAFLASDDASYITGTELTIDGAFTAR